MYLVDFQGLSSGTPLATYSEIENRATMQRMARHRDFRNWLGMGTLCLALGLGQACARSEPLHPESANGPTVAKQLPFRAGPEGFFDRGNDTAGLANASSTGLPFRPAARGRILPAGTLLTVQLEHSLSATNVHAGDVFEAALAAPLMIDGDTLIERGTEVTGRVESAQFRPGSGYVRMTLSAITLEGAPVSLQTSSLFARGRKKQVTVADAGNSSKRDPGGVRVQKGRRLTFRLTAPVTLEEPLTQNRDRAANASSE
jgi:hypothetical protein